MNCFKCKKKVVEAWWDVVKCSVCGKLAHVGCQVTLTESALKKIHEGEIPWTCTACKRSTENRPADKPPDAAQLLAETLAQLDASTAKCQQIVKACNELKDQNERTKQRLNRLCDALAKSK